MSTERIIRPSSLVDFLDCPRRWAARNLRKEVEAAGYDLAERRPSGAGALVGSGVHAGAAWTLEQMRGGGAAGAEATAIDAAVEGFRERAAEEGAEWDDTTPSANTAEKQIARMVRVYRRQIAPQLAPIEIEERMETVPAPGWVLSGQVDALAAALGAEAGQTLRDTKTGRVKRANGIQYGAYSLILEAHGFKPVHLLEDYIPRVALSKEQPGATTTEFNAHDARMDAWQAIQGIMAATEEFAARAADPNGDDPRGPFRPNPSSSLCSAKFCPARNTRWCRSHRPD